MSMDMDGFDDVVTGDAGEVPAGTGSAEGVGLAGETDPSNEAIEVANGQDQDVSQELGVRYIDPGRLEGGEHLNQILTVCPSDEQVLEMASDLRGKVEEYASAHGGRGLDVDAVKVEPWDARPELGSYSDREITISNYTEQVDISTVTHELMHSASFQSQYVEQMDSGWYVQRDICGLDTVTSVYSESGALVYQGRDGELVNEGLTVSYSRSCLEGQGLGIAASTDEALSYELASNVAESLRASFPEETDAAYFQGRAEGLCQAFDDAAGRAGSFDEMSSLLDRVADQSLSLDERASCYDRVQELTSKACG